MENMLKVTKGNLFDSGAQALVNTANCVGIMGKGVALEFKHRFPDMYKDYVSRCSRGEVQLGKPYLYRELFLPWVINFPTKDHWRSVSRLADIVAGLEYLEDHYREWGIASLAVPPLGCGNGQLEWRIVGPTLYRHLNRLGIPVTLYGPEGVSDEQLTPDFLSKGQRSGDSSNPGVVRAAWVALVAIVDRINREPYHWPIGRTMFQKTAYFATKSGLPTGFEFRRASFGPFAPQLKGVTTRLVNNGTLLEEKQGSRFTVFPGPTFDDAARSFRKELEEWEGIIAKVADLFMRMNPRGAEIAATIHFAAQEIESRLHGQASEREVLEAVMQWKVKRDPPFHESEVAETVRNLNLLGWVNLSLTDDLPVPDYELVAI
jgi:O-acetyl-ADP-ribose deacetylase (regulator of RNase III)/uncharacterized protein YwgA